MLSWEQKQRKKVCTLNMGSDKISSAGNFPASISTVVANGLSSDSSQVGTFFTFI